ncbi:hypothetical protein EG327_008989 [Venturia inaequalis]|uniref:Uncharacterized protein n=1 Tax=Venturia inaequalis TaxID=5025 RepID=A0A8H3UPA9_VENIN|nr:hypothetical protein EG327_008989 [Venturia inaequalis]
MPPPNKSRDNQQIPTRPLMPTLASSRNVKSPMTPRLAGQYLAATTRSNSPSTVKNGPGREDLATPVKALISTNVTPRSSSRIKTSSPNGTPTVSRPVSVAAGGASGNGSRPTGIAGLGISNGSGKSRPISMVGGGYPGTISPSIGSAGMGSMFFHAEEIPAAQEPTKEAKKTPAFFYANGQHEEGPARALRSPSPALSNAGTSRPQKSQFFRADRTDNVDIPPSQPLSSTPPVQGPSSVPFLQAAPVFRAPSPTKDVFNLHLSYRKGASQVLRPNDRPKTVAILPPLISPRQRSISGELSRRPRHGRTSSLSSIESGSSSRKHSLAALETCGLSPLHTPSNLINVTSSPILNASAPPSARRPSLVSEEMHPSLRSLQDSLSAPLTFSRPQSPTKPMWSPQAIPESITNARVERKIQDLEISNSSLMAINRSLEKEVRRQKKELRQFRRLSRAGRLSDMSMVNLNENYDIVAESGISPLPAVSEGEEEEASSEEEEEDEDEDEEEENDELSTDSSSGEEGDSKKLAKDSKRLQIDLSKHRDILVDSQKMNQSLKRCMTWTEDLIREGKKALEYKVNVSDVKLGGRILEPIHADEDEEHYEADHSLLSTWSATPTPILEGQTGILDGGRKSWQSEAADSGIEVDRSSGSRLPGEGLEGLHDTISELTASSDECPEMGVS